MPIRRRKGADLKAIGSRIRQLRGEALQEEFAAHLGISQGQLSKVEHGRIAPTLEVLILIAEEHGKTLDWIVWGE